MFGDRHVNDSSTVVREDDEHEEEFGRHDEEFGRDLGRVIRQKRSPGCDAGRGCRCMYLATVD
jgi:hypothetical protein